MSEVTAAIRSVSAVLALASPKEAGEAFRSLAEAVGAEGAVHVVGHAVTSWWRVAHLADHDVTVR